MKSRERRCQSPKNSQCSSQFSAFMMAVPGRTLFRPSGLFSAYNQPYTLPDSRVEYQARPFIISEPVCSSYNCRFLHSKGPLPFWFLRLYVSELQFKIRFPKLEAWTKQGGITLAELHARYLMTDPVREIARDLSPLASRDFRLSTTGTIDTDGLHSVDQLLYVGPLLVLQTLLSAQIQPDFEDCE